MKTTAQKRKESREARAADPYAYQRSQERKKKPARRPENIIRENTVEGATARISLYISTYPEYLDRDRDLILLYIVRTLGELKSRP